MTRIYHRESFSPGVFLPGEKVAKPDEGELARISPHPNPLPSDDPTLFRRARPTTRRLLYSLSPVLRGEGWGEGSCARGGEERPISSTRPDTFGSLPPHAARPSPPPSPRKKTRGEGVTSPALPAPAETVGWSAGTLTERAGESG